MTRIIKLTLLTAIAALAITAFGFVLWLGWHFDPAHMPAEDRRFAERMLRDGKGVGR